jgi:hypothetical protein
LSQLDADTILIVEVRNTGIHWMEPGDLDLRHLPQTIAADTSADSFHVGFADGEVWLLDAKVPVDELRKFLTLEGARQWDRQSCLGPYGRRVYPN